MRSAFRALRIARVLHKHRLDALLESTALGKWLWLLRPFTPTAQEERDFPRGKRLRLALQELGPIFVKFGQVLSTRRDLLPPDIADELNLLRDQVPQSGAAHAVTVVGYRSDGTPEGTVFIYRNSYGPQWGLGGYGLMDASYLKRHAIAAFCLLLPQPEPAG